MTCPIVARRSFLALAALAPAAVLAGCSGSAQGSTDADAQAVSDGLSALLADLGNGMGAVADALKARLEALVGDQLAEMGVATDDLVAHYLDGFSSEVGDVDVTGSTATAHVRVRCRSVAGIVADFLSSGSSEGLELLACVDAAEPADNDVIVVCKKGDDGSWDCEDGLIDKLESLAAK